MSMLAPTMTTGFRMMKRSILTNISLKKKNKNETSFLPPFILRACTTTTPPPAPTPSVYPILSPLKHFFSDIVFPSRSVPNSQCSLLSSATPLHTFQVSDFFPFLHLLLLVNCYIPLTVLSFLSNDDSPFLGFGLKIGAIGKM